MKFKHMEPLGTCPFTGRETHLARHSKINDEWFVVRSDDSYMRLWYDHVSDLLQPNWAKHVGIEWGDLCHLYKNNKQCLTRNQCLEVWARWVEVRTTYISDKPLEKNLWKIGLCHETGLPIYLKRRRSNWLLVRDDHCCLYYEQGFGEPDCAENFQWDLSVNTLHMFPSKKCSIEVYKKYRMARRRRIGDWLVEGF